MSEGSMGPELRVYLALPCGLMGRAANDPQCGFASSWTCNPGWAILIASHLTLAVPLQRPKGTCPCLDCRCLMAEPGPLNPSQVRQGDSECPPRVLLWAECSQEQGTGWGSMGLELGSSFAKSRHLRALALCPSLCRSAQAL